MLGLTRTESFALLRWLDEAGADEAIGETASNRFTAGTTAQRRPAAAATVPAKAHPSVSEANPPAEAVSASGAAYALALSCATLAELKAALHTFDGCDLKRFATNTVFADGTPEGRIMLIGEAPGRDEDAQGLPFVGRAGKLLDLMLAAVGLDRTKVYITNVLPWRPPQNRDPTPEEAAACLPFLHRHITLAAPELIVLLGKVAVHHVLGKHDPITRIRGTWDSYHAEGRAVPVMPTLHPAYLLRQPAAKRLAWRDLLTIREKAESLGLV